MRRITLFALMLTFCFASSASAAPKPNVPEKYKKEFIEHYKFWIDGDTQEAFEKLTTDQERDNFISNFWKERDTDPNTPENEYKDEVDQRFLDIQNEVFITDPDIPGVSFSGNGSMNGDMAHVYLLYGDPGPGLKLKMFNGQYYVDLMLWLYPDESGQNLKYLFLFYRKNNIGPLQLLRNYSRDLGWALAEVSRFRGKDLSDTYDELQLMSGQEGRLITIALTQFSLLDSSINIDDALDPPKPAALIVRESRARVVGQPEISKDIKILYSKEHSFIPANFEIVTTSTLEVPKTKSIGISLGIKYGDLDWVVDREQLKCVLQLKLVIQNKQTKEVNFYSWMISLTIPKAKLAEDQNFYRSIPLEELVGIVNNNPPGAYRINAYLKNILTNKYNAWLEEVTK